MIPSRRYRKPDGVKLRELNSKDLTRAEVYKYIFGDFIKGMFIFGSLFLDLLIVTQVYYLVPRTSPTHQIIRNFALGLDLVQFYVWILTGFVEIVVIILEAYFYHVKLQRYLTIQSYYKK